jgi:hypothetical protein
MYYEFVLSSLSQKGEQIRPCVGHAGKVHIFVKPIVFSVNKLSYELNFNNFQNETF